MLSVPRSRFVQVTHRDKYAFNRSKAKRFSSQFKLGRKNKNVLNNSQTEIVNKKIVHEHSEEKSLKLYLILSRT